jgi:hypothetical protein
MIFLRPPVVAHGTCRDQKKPFENVVSFERVRGVEPSE